MTPLPTLTFLGGAETVTGSRHLIDVAGEQVLLDCGLFQGLKQLRSRNWEDPGFDAAALQAVVLSHAHLDHSGYLPRLVRRGFSGPIFCTPGTADLVAIVLRDSARLEEEDAARANSHGYTKHAPALPLYSRQDAERALRLLEPRPYGEWFQVSASTRVLFRRAGHILGSATVELEVGGEHPCRLVFSGDLGRWNRPILRDPELVPEADVLLVESTYGDRDHLQDSKERLAAVVAGAIERGGVIVVPAFAVGRTQELLWTLNELEEAGRLPTVPTFVDSPMANQVTDLYCRHPEDHDVDMKLLMDAERCPLHSRSYHVVRTAEESRALNARPGPAIIIAGSGMATGGRVLHHLRARLTDPRNTILLTSFQADGTRGRALEQGAPTLRIHGRDVPVRARVEKIDGLSAHADRGEILRWLQGFRRPPRRTYVVHGERAASAALSATIESRLGWQVEVARFEASVPLSGQR